MSHSPSRHHSGLLVLDVISFPGDAQVSCDLPAWRSNSRSSRSGPEVACPASLPSPLTPYPSPPHLTNNKHPASLPACLPDSRGSLTHPCPWPVLSYTPSCVGYLCVCSPFPHPRLSLSLSAYSLSSVRTQTFPNVFHFSV